MFELPPNWRWSTVSRIAAKDKYACVGGPFGSKLSRKHYVEAPGVPVVRGQNLGDPDRQFIDADFVFVSEEKADTLLSNMAYPGDLVFTQRGTLGQVGRIPAEARFERYVISQSQMKLTVDGDVADPDFIYAFFRSRWALDYIARTAITTGVPHINLGILREFPVPVPPLHEQRHVAAVLGALDDKIELNRKMNCTLEEMAQAIFKSRFVDFDGHADLAESKMGKIPRGWEVSHLGEVLELKRGYDLPKKQRKPGNIPIISSSGISGWHDAARVDGPVVATGRYGTIGQVLFVPQPAWPLNTSLYVRDFKGYPPRFAYHVLGQVNWSAYLGKSAVPGVNRNHVHLEKIVRPPVEAAQAFVEAVEPLWAKHDSNKAESQTLAEIRDALLPKLISGELSLSGGGS